VVFAFADVEPEVGGVAAGHLRCLSPRRTWFASQASRAGSHVTTRPA
jgi:hypothetical protein